MFFSEADQVIIVTLPASQFIRGMSEVFFSRRTALPLVRRIE